MSDRPTRHLLNRGFAAALAGSTVLAGCKEEAPKAPQPPVVASPGTLVAGAQKQNGNLFDALKEWRFMGADGKQVDTEALRRELKDKYVTLAFGFDGCEQFCPFLNPTLAALGARHKGELVSVFVNVTPELSGLNQSMRDSYEVYLRKFGIDHPLVALYPLDGEKVKAGPLAAALSNDIPPRIATSLNLLANQSRSFDHSAQTILYAPGGNELARKLSTKLSVEDWDGLIASPGKAR